MTPSPHIPVSWGELIDKITILEIKTGRMSGEARARVGKELALLQAIAAPVQDAAILALAARLRTLNENLWQVEDQIRGKDAAGQFDAEFIALARAVYHTNDERGAVKRQINLHLKSDLMEEKNYRPYGKDT